MIYVKIGMEKPVISINQQIFVCCIEIMAAETVRVDEMHGGGGKRILLPFTCSNSHDLLQTSVSKTRKYKNLEAVTVGSVKSF
jgi:hypothetical protein